jgi:hypothetical protein
MASGAYRVRQRFSSLNTYELPVCGGHEHGAGEFAWRINRREINGHALRSMAWWKRHGCIERCVFIALQRRRWQVAYQRNRM